MKKFLSLILAGVTLATASVTANASEIPSENTQAVISAEDSGLTTYTSGNYEYNFDPWDSENIIINKYLGNEKTVTVPSQLDGHKVTKIGSSAFFRCTGIEKVIIPNTIKTISGWAFFGCKSLKTIEISESVSYIAHDAFSLCTSLNNFKVSSDNPNFKTIDGVLYTKDKNPALYSFPAGRSGIYVIPNGVAEIKDYAFLDCINLQGITVPNSVVTISRFAFYTTSDTPGKENSGKLYGYYTVYGHRDSPVESALFDSMQLYTQFEIGDLNGDGNISAIDALLVQRYVIGLEDLNNGQITAGRISQLRNGKTLYNVDALEILRYIVGLNSKLEERFYPDEIPY